MTETPSTRKRASRYIRPETLPVLHLTERDKLVIKAVNDLRVMRQEQIQRLFFPSRNTAQVRLQLLWQHGYLKREFLSVIGGIQTSPILYVLDTRGADLLQQEFGYDRADLRMAQGKGLDMQFIEHTLGLAEVRVAVELACRGHGAQLKKWWDEKTLKEEYDRVRVGNKLVSVLPDAYFVIGLPGGDLHFFLEFDRGSESLKVLKGKLLAYQAYFLSGKCKDRYGTDRIRVLTVTQSAGGSGGRDRLAHLRKIAQEVRQANWFWFTSLAQVVANDLLFGPVWWQTAKEAPAALVSR